MALADDNLTYQKHTSLYINSSSGEKNRKHRYDRMRSHMIGLDSYTIAYLQSDIKYMILWKHRKDTITSYEKKLRLHLIDIFYRLLFLQYDHRGRFLGAPAGEVKYFRAKNMSICPISSAQRNRRHPRIDRWRP